MNGSASRKVEPVVLAEICRAQSKAQLERIVCVCAIADGPVVRGAFTREDGTMEGAAVRVGVELMTIKIGE